MECVDGLVRHECDLNNGNGNRSYVLDRLQLTKPGRKFYWAERSFNGDDGDANGRVSATWNIRASVRLKGAS